MPSILFFSLLPEALDFLLFFFPLDAFDRSSKKEFVFQIPLIINAVVPQYFLSFVLKTKEIDQSLDWTLPATLWRSTGTQV